MSKVSKQQSKKAKIFLKELEKIGTITQTIKKLMSQKYNYEPKTNSHKVVGLVNMLHKLQLLIEKDD